MYPLVIYLISGFWYMKNSILFGNPFYPMYGDPVFEAQVHWFVIPPTFWNFFAFPFYTFDRWFFSDRESSSRLLVFFYFIFTYVGMAFFALIRKRFSMAEILSFVFVELYLLLLFLSSHQIRFLLPSLIMVVVTLALLTDKFLVYIKEKKQDNTYQKLLTWAKRGSIAIFIVIFLGNIHYFEIKFRYILGLYTEKEYIIVIGGQ